MLDLLGDQVTATPLINNEHGFSAWWKLIPSDKRKVGKPWCLQAWKTRGLAQDATHIMLYTKWRYEQDDYKMGFNTLPKTFINAAGWVDWVPPVAVNKIDPALQKIMDHEKLPKRGPPAGMFKKEK